MQLGRSFVFLSLFSFFMFAEGVASGTKMVISGNIKNDSVQSKNSTLLNSKITADAYNYSKLCMDLNFDFFGGDSSSVSEDDYVIKGHSTIRTKTVWGNIYESFKTDEAPVGIGQGMQIGAHSHNSSKPGLWIRELNLETRLNRLAGRGAKYVQADGQIVRENPYSLSGAVSDLKIGYFFYSLGRGISFGAGYGTDKSFLGIYNRQNDFAAPGVLLTSKVGPFVVDLYFCKYEGRSASSRQTMAPKRENQIGSTFPWAGSGMDENLYSAKLEYLVNRGPWLTGKTYTYVFLDDAPAKKVEFDYDSSSQLGSWGLGCDFCVENFEIGAECIFNFGQEVRYSIDRNVRLFEKNADGSQVQKYSHVLNASDSKKAFVTDSLSAYMLANPNVQMLPSGQTFSDGVNNYKNADRRIRPWYQTNYSGFAIVADAAYSVKVFDGAGVVKFAGEIGAASGDKDPSTKEADGQLERNYKGFIGLDECYSGNRVKSVIMLDDRNTRRPMTLGDNAQVNQPSIGSDSTFTDLMYYGLGINFKTKCRNGIKHDYGFNVLHFYKYDPSKKINLALDGTPSLSTTEMARRDLGIEFNTIMRWNFECGMTTGLALAAFRPGGYYADISGARLKNDAISYLNQQAAESISAKDFSIGNNVSWFGKLEIGYKF